MNHVLVTGAAGFLGREVVRRAQAAGLQVRVTDRHRGNLPADIDFRPADILIPQTLQPLFDGIDGVIHVAGLAHVFDKSRSAAAPFHEINALGTTHVARAAAEARVKSLVLVSSVSVYGSHRKQPVDETFSCRPQTPYAQSKHEAEQRATEIARNAGMRLTILRMATLYGEGDPGNVARLMRTIDRRRFLWIGNGSNQKSLLHRDDAARACVAAAIQPQVGIQTYNVASPPCAMRRIVETIAEALSCKIPSWHIPAPVAIQFGRAAGVLSFGRSPLAGLPATLEKWLADDAYRADRFERDFEFRTEVSLMEGIGRQAASYRAIARIAA